VSVLLLVWEFGSRARAFDVRLFPAPSDVAVRFVQLWLDETFLTNLIASLERMMVGYALAALVGIGLGLLMGYWSGMYVRLELLIELLRPVPPVALLPALILFLGIGEPMRISLILIGALWPILINTIGGVRSVHSQLLDLARIYHLSSAGVLVHVLLPGALPHIMAGLRVSLAIALILALVSEMIGTDVGLGHFIVSAQRGFRILDVYAGMLLLALVGYSLNRLFLLAQWRVLGPRSGGRKVALA
jgi:ABC-type nitrate/sulfonate/bicarbonate transport system permease component